MRNEMQLMRQGDGHNTADREPRSMQQVHQEEAVSSDMGGLCELRCIRNLYFISDACEVRIHMKEEIKEEIKLVLAITLYMLLPNIALLILIWWLHLWI